MPKAQGGDPKSQRIEAQATVILAIMKDEPDITLEELQGLLRNRAQPFVCANNCIVSCDCAFRPLRVAGIARF